MFVILCLHTIANEVMETNHIYLLESNNFIPLLLCEYLWPTQKLRIEDRTGKTGNIKSWQNLQLSTQDPVPLS